MAMKHINAIGKFEQEHFDPATVSVDRRGLDVAALLGRDLSDLKIAQLSGAPSNSRVRLRVLTQRAVDEEEEDVPPGLYFFVSNRKYIRSHHRVGIYRRSAATCGIYVKSIDFFPGKVPGLAARMLAIMVRSAPPFIRELRLLAAGGRQWPDLDPATGERWGGYVAWPTYGFDMPLLEETTTLTQAFPHYPKGLGPCKKVSDLLRLKGGRDFWKVNGDGAYMTFDLAAGSRSRATLDSYLGSKGL